MSFVQHMNYLHLRSFVNVVPHRDPRIKEDSNKIAKTAN